MKEQIKELIRKGKLQKYMKKGDFSRFRDGNRTSTKALRGTRTTYLIVRKVQ